MWVKICANTRVEDAVEAARLGADAVGFVFAESKRRVSAEQVRAITAELPDGVERVGVFGEVGAEEIARAVETAGLTAVQLHGGYNQAVVERLGELVPGVGVIPVVHWDVADREGSIRSAAAQFDKVAGYGPGRRVLVDAKVAGVTGGTGQSFDWESARDVLDAQRERGLWVVLAGGLKPETVGEAVRVLRPWGVDVASGVESEPGRKDFEKLRRFIENARGA